MKRDSRPFEKEGRPGASENPVDKLRAMHARLAVRTSQARRKAMPPAPPQVQPQVEVADASTVEPDEQKAKPAPQRSRWK